MAYAIRKIRSFYNGKTVKTYVTDSFNDDKRAEFKFRAEAQKIADQLDDAIYYTAHNESGRAEYKVVRVN